MNTGVHDTHSHACSHMANRLNFMYDTGIHIDTSLHMYTPYIGNIQNLSREHECAYS